MRWEMPNLVVVAVATVALSLATVAGSQRDFDNEIRTRIELIKSSILNKLGMRQPPELDGLVLQDRIRKYKNDHGLRFLPGASGAPSLPEHEKQARQVPHSREDQRSRARRNADKTSTETRCSRIPLTIDFEEFGWNWLVVPKRYQANYCKGDCSSAAKTNNPYNRMLYLKNDANYTVATNCRPHTFSPISMLYFDENLNIVYGLLPDMVVDSCSCS